MFSYKESLNRSIKAFDKIYKSSLLCTTQTPLECDDILEFVNCQVLPPTKEVKLKIATQAAGCDLSTDSETLCSIVDSCLEAELVGKTTKQVNTKTSRFGLFNTYSRNLLGSKAMDGIQALAKIACYLSKDISFSISIQELERYANKEKINSDIIETLKATKLLIKRGNNISFRHEMFFYAYLAESIIRQADNCDESILEALNDPRNNGCKGFVIGGIDNTSVLEKVLKKVTDTQTFALCIAGECGQYACFHIKSR